MPPWLGTGDKRNHQANAAGIDIHDRLLRLKIETRNPRCETATLQPYHTPTCCGRWRQLNPQDSEFRGWPDSIGCSVTLSRQNAGVPPGAPAWCRLTATGLSGVAINSDFGLRVSFGLRSSGLGFGMARTDFRATLTCGLMACGPRRECPNTMRGIVVTADRNPSPRPPPAPRAGRPMIRCTGR